MNPHRNFKDLNCIFAAGRDHCRFLFLSPFRKHFDNRRKSIAFELTAVNICDTMFMKNWE